MSETAWTSWFDEVMPELPGAPPSALVKHAIRNAAIEFCTRSWVWVLDQGPIPVVANLNEYDWQPPSNTEVARILVAWLEKKPLTPKTRNELSAMYGDYMRATGTPVYFIQDVPSKLIVVPKPTANITDGVTAKIAVKPKRAATGLDSVIFERWADDIANGAKARLMRMPKKPWTSAANASDYEAKFEDAIATAKLEMTRSFAGARLRVKPNFF